MKGMAFVAACTSLLCAPLARAGDYEPAHCRAVERTMNIFWEYVNVHPGETSCTGIEYTNGSFADTVDGTFSMTGTSVSNPQCIYPAAYAFTLSLDKTTLTGSDTANNVPMTLTLTPDGACYVGYWSSGGYDYVATIWAVAVQGAEIFNDEYE